MKRIRWILQSLVLTLLLATALAGCGQTAGEQDTSAQIQITDTVANAAGSENELIQTEQTETSLTPDNTGESEIDEDGSYTSKEDVALYLHTYGRLPENFITKKEAQALGWDNKAGNLWDVAPDMSIGGDRFGNYEGLLPDADGRKYYECDIDYAGGYRGSKRIIYSNDGLIYYTEDHYESFEQLY